MKINNRKQLVNRVIGVSLLVYAICYLILSINGHYTLEISGKTRLFSGSWPAHHVNIWEPKYLIVTRNNWNYPGLFFYAVG